MKKNQKLPMPQQQIQMKKPHKSKVKSQAHKAFGGLYKK